MFLPLLFTFILSEGTQHYLSQHINSELDINTVKNIILYNGIVLNSRTQFAVSELSFMLMMCAILSGLNVFEERTLHVWDRVVCKRLFLLIKFVIHFLFTVIMIGVNTFFLKMAFNISFSVKAILIFLSIPIISIPMGILVGMNVKNRTLLSNTILMIVMMMGYFGGALSLTSVLSNTRFMNLLMYISPLTIANKLIFKEMIHIAWTFDIVVWIVLCLVLSTIFTLLISWRIKNGASI